MNIGEKAVIKNVKQILDDIKKAPISTTPSGKRYYVSLLCSEILSVSAQVDGLLNEDKEN